MKRVTMILFALVVLALPVNGQSEGTSTLVIRITGLGPEQAQIRIAVYDSDKTWLDEPSAVYMTVLEGETREWRIGNVPNGEYAVAVFHDQNRDGKLNRYFFGLPREGYGFSNNARGVFGPASWEDARFAVTRDAMELAIEVK